MISKMIMRLQKECRSLLTRSSETWTCNYSTWMRSVIFDKSHFDEISVRHNKITDWRVRKKMIASFFPRFCSIFYSIIMEVFFISSLFKKDICISLFIETYADILFQHLFRCTRAVSDWWLCTGWAILWRSGKWKFPTKHPTCLSPCTDLWSGWRRALR